MMQILVHTPAWVFGLLTGLVILGLQQTRNREVARWLAYLLPAGMVILSLVGVTSNFGAHWLAISLWLAGLCAMALLGYQLMPVKHLHYLAESNRFYIPGSWIPLLVILAIFFTKYCVAVLVALGNPLVMQTGFMPTMCLIYGGFSGYFVARALGLVRAFYASEKTLRAE